MNIFKTSMLEVFKKVAEPTSFISNFYAPKLLDGISIELQGQDVAATYSVDTKIGTGGRRHSFGYHDTKTIVVPEYNDFVDISEEDAYRVQLGETAYTKQVGSLVNLVTNRQKDLSAMQKRAEEKQAVDALFNGKIVLADGQSIEFRKKETHNIDCTGKKWNAIDGGVSTNDPLKSIEEACKLCVNDGRITGGEFNLILEDEGASALLSNTIFINNSNQKHGINRTNISIPEEKTLGAFFHGQFSAGSYTINLWSYNAQYAIPKGFNFANEGKQTTYIPKGAALIIPTKTEFVRAYGSLNEVAPQKALPLGGTMALVKAEQLPYAYPLVFNGSNILQAGVKSRPLYIPKNIDATCTLTNLV
ncbi:major capsid protein [bacterium]|nr:major capsid protein [bacterium]